MSCKTINAVRYQVVMEAPLLDIGLNSSAAYFFVLHEEVGRPEDYYVVVSETII